MLKVRRETMMLFGIIIIVIMILALAAKVSIMESYVEDLEDRLDTLEEYYIDNMRTNVEHAKSKKRFEI